MTEHYYSNKTDAPSEERTWEYTLKGETLRFTTDNAVFSKKEVDFGSRVLIEAFRAPEVDGGFLDLGCGYGAIGLTLAKVHPGRKVYMVDINERAVELSRKNAEQNEISNVVVEVSDRISNVQDVTFAAVLTNPPIRAGKKVVHAMFEDAYRSLVDKGELWVVIQKKQGAPSARKKLEELFSEVEVVDKQKRYYIFRAKKV
ncbi:16S rRNA (guanine1207-N2)-methyltransferase [Thalassobacillus cyri]|uniref:16S rRNA (Guanine1207-N2)-methyltransferase n=1 Tax=Thalassobacillus cyri TaxID=571932 RepID=A0A1H4HB03_9BACI|nr:class I SAM-dependent methyltransferase [Thalassobacillus cyri]SEB18846.1 16S rRNA (guanine1207-N2)-methyltransferase [Thalassobacillus cyri]